MDRDGDTCAAAASGASRVAPAGLGKALADERADFDDEDGRDMLLIAFDSSWTACGMLRGEQQEQ